jgi:hypothetical protein
VWELYRYRYLTEVEVEVVHSLYCFLPFLTGNPFGEGHVNKSNHCNLFIPDIRVRGLISVSKEIISAGQLVSDE